MFRSLILQDEGDSPNQSITCFIKNILWFSGPGIVQRVHHQWHSHLLWPNPRADIEGNPGAHEFPHWLPGSTSEAEFGSKFEVKAHVGGRHFNTVVLWLTEKRTSPEPAVKHTDRIYRCQVQVFTTSHTCSSFHSLQMHLDFHTWITVTHVHTETNIIPFSLTGCKPRAHKTIWLCLGGEERSDKEGTSNLLGLELCSWKFLPYKHFLCSHVLVVADLIPASHHDNSQMFPSPNLNPSAPLWCGFWNLCSEDGMPLLTYQSQHVTRRALLKAFFSCKAGKPLDSDEFCSYF